uniref:SigB/SigF/SigG family RNA polymerase sigma factor n=1 Tax=Armatimonas sp. TaxID=1872638 RepID=UPI00286B5856
PFREGSSVAELERLLCEYTTSRDPQLRDTLILHHQRLVRSIAVRFVGGDETLEDLIQVGNIGLINALDRYDPHQGTRFSTYATPTILGEIRRHFRDKAVGIKIPRWLQELQQAVRRVSNELSQVQGHPPTPQEIALRLEVSEEHILLAMESQEVSNLISLDSQLDTRSTLDSTTLMDLLGKMDRLLFEFDSFADLRNALSTLETREREVIAMRFYDELSQAKIAERLDISQMHVSRLQKRALSHLRDFLADEPPAAPRRARRKP